MQLGAEPLQLPKLPYFLLKVAVSQDFFGIFFYETNQR